MNGRYQCGDAETFAATPRHVCLPSYAIDIHTSCIRSQKFSLSFSLSSRLFREPLAEITRLGKNSSIREYLPKITAALARNCNRSRVSREVRRHLQVRGEIAERCCKC